MTPAGKLTDTTKFEHFWMQKDTNFGNARILRHFGPEKCQNQPQKIHEFRQCHNSSLPWARESPTPTMKDTNFGKLHNQSNWWRISGQQVFYTARKQMSKIRKEEIRNLQNNRKMDNTKFCILFFIYVVRRRGRLAPG